MVVRQIGVEGPGEVEVLLHTPQKRTNKGILLVSRSPVSANKHRTVLIGSGPCRSEDISNSRVSTVTGQAAVKDKAVDEVKTVIQIRQT